MTSSIEDELRAQVVEFAKSDDSLKETISRLGELESLITAHQNSRDTLDQTSESLRNLVKNLNSLLTVSTSAVGDLARISMDIAPVIRRLEDEITASISKNIDRATTNLESSARQMAEIAESQKLTVGQVTSQISNLEHLVETRLLSLETRLDDLAGESDRNFKKVSNYIFIAVFVSLTFGVLAFLK